MLSICLMVRAARTLPARRRDQVSLVCRPAGVVHVAVSPVTPSGRWMSSAGRTVCHVRTRRLSLVPRVQGLPDIAGRRPCARCLQSLAVRTDVPGLDGQPLTRDQEQQVFELLTPGHLTTITATCRTVDETHQIGRLASVLFGPTLMKPKARRTTAEQERVDLEETIHAVRRRLTTAAMTDEEREAVARVREFETAEHAQIQTAHRRGAARDRAVDRRNSGGHLLPHERALLNSA